MKPPIYPASQAQTELVHKLGQSISNTTVLQALNSVPRHRFISSGWSAQAYADTALPIGFGQTISQPLVVARMTELLCNYLQTKPRKAHKVLEIGAGCGYQAAILQHCFREVYAIERDINLFKRTVQLLDQLGYEHIRLMHGDGMLGCPQRAPYDAVIFSCALNINNTLYQGHGFERQLKEVLQPLFNQLGQLSCLLVPAGSRYEQRLCFFVRHKTDWQMSLDLPVRFVACTPGVNEDETA